MLESEKGLYRAASERVKNEHTALLRSDRLRDKKRKARQ
jgi:hypothetical protein